MTRVLVTGGGGQLGGEFALLLGEQAAAPGHAELDVADQAVILNTGRCVFAGPAGDLANNEELIVQNLGVFHAH